MDDLELLKAYSDHRDQEAFAQLVRRHGPWLYGAARRQLGDGHLAEDATQAVFLLLSRGASRLRRYRYLNGWLFLALGYCIRNVKQQRSRRERREQEAAAMRPEKLEKEAGWEEVAPELEAAVGKLGAKDRDAVLLRFYEQRSLAEVGRLQGVSEEAARKRVERAIERLRESLATRGVETVGLSGLMLMHAGEGGVDGVVERIVEGVGNGAGSGMAGGIAQGAGKMMVLANVKATAALIVVAGVAATTAGLVLSSATIAATAPAPAATRPAQSALSSPTTVPAATQSLADLRKVLQANESAIKTCQGVATQTEIAYVVLGPPGAGRRKYEHPYPQPMTMAQYTITFKYDMQRPRDYWVRINFASGVVQFETSETIERRSGETVEAMLSDAGGPVMGIIGPPRDARILGHRPRNIDARAAVDELISSSPDGRVHLPMSELLGDENNVYVYDGEFTVSGVACTKLAVTSREGAATRLSFVYLGPAVGFSVVRMQTGLIRGSSTMADMRRMAGPRFREMLDSREASIAGTFMVNRDFRRLANGAWMPMRSTSYLLAHLQRDELGDGVTEQEVAQLALRDPETRHFRKMIVLGYHEFVLDGEALIVDAPIPASTFEDSVIQKGIPVHDFVRNIHPK